MTKGTDAENEMQIQSREVNQGSRSIKGLETVVKDSVSIFGVYTQFNIVFKGVGSGRRTAGFRCDYTPPGRMVLDCACFFIHKVRVKTTNLHTNQGSSEGQIR